MVGSVHLPKSVAITNFRLNAFFSMSSLGVVALCVWNFVHSQGGTIKVPNKPLLSLRIMMKSIAGATRYNHSRDRMCSLPGDWQQREIRATEFPPITRVQERFRCLDLHAGTCN